MLARFEVMLPYILLVAPDLPLEPITVEAADGTTGLVHPPYKSAVPPEFLARDTTAAVTDIPPMLGPVEPQPVSDQNTIRGSPCVLADALRVDITGDFERTREALQALASRGFCVANEFLSRVRTLQHVGEIQPLHETGSFFRLRLLHDDGSEFEPHPERLRTLQGGAGRLFGIGLPPEFWRAVEEAPAGTQLAAWDALILDALEVLPHIGAALVLAAAAVETRAEAALDVVARESGDNAELWAWINDRGDYRKEPSVGEQLSVLLKALSGTSLKDSEPALWEAFRNLRDARNSLVHDGIALIGNRPVTLEDAQRLVVKAKDIVAWLSEQIHEPAGPQFTGETMGVQNMRLLVRRDEEAGGEGGTPGTVPS